MRRFFVEGIDRAAKKAEVAGSEFTHLKKVLRLGPGDEVSVFNGRGVELFGKIESIGPASAVISIEGEKDAASESPLELTLLQGLLKGDMPEFIVQKATELGADAICFYATERTVPKVEGEAAEKKLMRWRKAAIEAAKQCGRSTLPEITLAPSLKSAVEAAPAGLKLLLWEKNDAADLKELLSGEKPMGVALLVGPEGGISDDDAGAAMKAGFMKASMGPRILRAETAAVAAVSLVQHAFGDLR